MDANDELVEVFKALSDPTRLRLVQLLANSHGLCVNALAKRLGVTQSAVSQHLRVLRHAGLVAGSRQGSFIHYALQWNQLQGYRHRIDELLGQDAP